LTSGHKDVFLVAALRVSDLHPLRQLFRRIRRHTLPRRLRHLSEIKASAAPDRFRERLYHGLVDLGENLVIHSTILHTSDLPYPLREYEGILYAHVTTHTVAQCVNSNDRFINLLLDRRRTRNLPVTEFNAHLQAGIGFYLPARAYLEINHRDSTTEVGIQAADFVCWALYQKYQRGDTRWYEIIAPRVASERILF
jgi:hypothetical protein